MRDTIRDMTGRKILTDEQRKSMYDEMRRISAMLLNTNAEDVEELKIDNHLEYVYAPGNCEPVDMISKEVTYTITIRRNRDVMLGGDS